MLSSDVKRPRISPADCPGDDSDSEDPEEKRSRHSSPPLTVPQAPLTIPSLPSPDHLASPTTPESHDLDVDDDTETDGPENLSLKKPSTPETPPQQVQQQQQQQQQHQPQTPTFMPYHHFPQFPPSFQPQPQYPLQRSPVDILLRVFPGRRRSDVEAILQR